MPDVTLLRFLVATAQQDDDHVATHDEISAVACANVDTHLRNAIAYRLGITQVASGGPLKSACNGNASLEIAQAFMPIAELFGLLNHVGHVTQCIHLDTESANSACAIYYTAWPRHLPASMPPMVEPGSFREEHGATQDRIHGDC